MSDVKQIKLILIAVIVVVLLYFAVSAIQSDKAQSDKLIHDTDCQIHPDKTDCP